MKSENNELLNIVMKLSQDDLGKLLDFAIKLKKEELEESNFADY